MLCHPALLPAESPDTVHHEPHPSLLPRLCCEVADAKEQGQPYCCGGEHLLPQGLGSQGPAGIKMHGRLLPVCAPLPARPGFCRRHWSQMLMWAAVCFLTMMSKSPHLSPIGTPDTRVQGASGWRKWLLGYMESHSWDQGHLSCRYPCHAPHRWFKWTASIRMERCATRDMMRGQDKEHSGSPSTQPRV